MLKKVQRVFTYTLISGKNVVTYGISAETYNLRRSFPYRNVVTHAESKTTCYRGLGCFADYKNSKLSYKQFTDRFTTTAAIASLEEAQIPYSLTVRARNVKTGMPVPLPPRVYDFDSDLVDPSMLSSKWNSESEDWI